jgi:hypothetical protein
MLAQNHVVELVKPPTGDKTFDRGERIIVVDGVRWGRTVVTYHGCHGTAHKFRQEGGDILCENPNARYPREIAVRSVKRRRWTGDPWRPTHEAVLEKARELVAIGKLRHPDIVKAEHQKAMERYNERCAAIEEKRKQEFRERACQALGMNQDDGSQIIDRVVAAMEWAQTQ